MAHASSNADPTLLFELTQLHSISHTHIKNTLHLSLSASLFEPVTKTLPLGKPASSEFKCRKYFITSGRFSVIRQIVRSKRWTRAALGVFMLFKREISCQIRQTYSTHQFLEWSMNSGQLVRWYSHFRQLYPLNLCVAVGGGVGRGVQSIPADTELPVNPRD